MARIRTTKTLAQRVDRSYLGRVFPLARWRRNLTLLCLASALGWLGLHAVKGSQTPYSPGPLTSPHAFLTNDCAACHKTASSDQQCLGCHDGPVHIGLEKNKLSWTRPACATCHVEHDGALRLAGAFDRGCTRCHAGPRMATPVPSFAKHPEFAAVRLGTDAGGLKFNHQQHIGDFNMKCADCHVPAGPLMTQPNFETGCRRCHTLRIDPRITEPTPHHQQPAAIHAFLTAQFAKLGAPEQAAAAEKQLRERSCELCHNLQGGPDLAGTPVFADTKVTPPQVPAAWFPKAAFSHPAHQAMTCSTCHVKAELSELATDVLVPGIAQCRQCHQAGATSARADCSLCHVYHDWPNEKHIKGIYEPSR
jgi:hypothetical protein